MPYGWGWGWGVPQARYNPETSTLAGVPAAQLQAYLVALLSCRMQLMSGLKVASASYAQGDGSKSISYRGTAMATLLAEIQQVQKQLGLLGVSRRAYRPVF